MTDELTVEQRVDNIARWTNEGIRAAVIDAMRDAMRDRDVQIAALQAQQAMHAQFWAMEGAVVYLNADGATYCADTDDTSPSIGNTPGEAIAALLAQVEGNTK